MTTVGRWRTGTRVNLERSLKMGDELGGQRVAQQAGGVRAALRLAEQLLPFAYRRAAILDVGAGELAAVVEVLRVLLLERADLALDECVELVEERLDVRRDLNAARESVDYRTRAPRSTSASSAGAPPR